MAIDIDPSNLRAQLKDAFASADKNAAERVRHLQWVIGRARRGCRVRQPS